MDPAPAPNASGTGRIRLGILKNHWLAGTETYATLPLFEHLPRERFEVILYVLQETGDATEAACKSKVDRLVTLPPGVNEQAALLRRDKCDIVFYAINMTAVTHGLMPLAVHRVAPVQMTSICSPCTTGLLNMDYFLAGEGTEPREDAQAGYREKLLKFPGSGICFDYALRPPPSSYTISRQMLNLDENAIVLTSGANFFKVIPELRRAWAKMLAAAPPEAVLVLYPFGPAWMISYPAGSFLTCFQEDLTAAGVDPRRLIMLQPMESPSDVGKVMAITDVYVDSFPYSGATSLLDPLEAGVPPVTMRGDRLRFAQGEALLRELGMPELIADSEDHYIQLVTELARDQELRACRRHQVREKMAAGPAFLDSKRFGARAAELFERLVSSTT
jgi:predicted O-linked N-acetylglucosamine transferase (SPINDLY family)